ncbi:Protein PIN-LIKES 1 [Glycine max]|nr:Protein PIN-LIKES 1 [Glycine max]
MTNNSFAISHSQNFSFDSRSTFFWDNHTGSSSQCPHHPPPLAGTNQPQENLLLPTPHPRKPRGRPPGSKNKQKIISFPVAQPSEPFVRIVIINVDPGRDIMESILDVARQGHVNLTVLSTSGTVTKVTLQNSLHGAAALTLHGPFTLLSLNGSYLINNHHNHNSGATLPPPSSFGIHLSTSGGQAIGGAIGGQVIAGDNVKITVSTFWNPEMYKYIPEGNKGGNDDNNDRENNYNNNPIDCNGGWKPIGVQYGTCLYLTDLTPSTKCCWSHKIPTVFTSTLVCSILAKTIAFKSLVAVWFMPLNILLTFIIGTTLGWLFMKITKAPPDMQGLVLGCCAAGKTHLHLDFSIFNVNKIDDSTVGRVSEKETDLENHSTGPVIIAEDLSQTNDHVSQFGSECTLPGGRDMMIPKQKKIMKPMKTLVQKLNLKVILAHATIRPILGLIICVVRPFQKMFVGDDVPLGVIEDSSSLLGLTSFWDNHTGSSSQCPHHPPPLAGTNQPQENLLLPTPHPRKTRGRPPGSKNKQKIISFPVAQPSEPFVRIVIINVDPGRDIMESILDVARQGNVNLTVLSTSGTVTKVTLQNSLHGAAALTLHGPFTLLSLNGSYLINNHHNLNSGATLPPPSSFGIHLSTSGGQAIGGVIGGQVIAGDDVKITVSIFWNPEMYKYIPQGNNGGNDDNNNRENNYNNNPVDCNGGGNQLGFNMVSCGIRGWFMPLNILLTFIIGTTLGWLFLKITKAPPNILICEALCWGVVLQDILVTAKGYHIPLFIKEQTQNLLIFNVNKIDDSAIGPMSEKIMKPLKTLVQKLNLKVLLAPATIRPILGLIIGVVTPFQKMFVGDDAPLRVIEDSPSMLG